MTTCPLIIRVCREYAGHLVAPSVSPRSMEHSEAGDIPGPLLERTLRRLVSRILPSTRRS